MKRRIFSSLMALVLVVSLLPMEVFAEETQPVTEPAVSADEPVTEPKVPAPMVPETSAPTVPETSDPTVPSTEPPTESEPITESVTEPDTAPETENTTEPSTEASEPETVLVTAWTWVDPEEYLEDGGLALPGASADMPATFEVIVSMLPAAILVDSTELPLAWNCPGFPAGGAYQGTYTFTATLPEGYALVEGKLTVLVDLGGAETLEIQEGYGYTFDWDTGTLTINDSLGATLWTYDLTDKTLVKSLIIEDGVTGIVSQGFQGCTALTSVTFPANLTSIGAFAFESCSSLEEITIPSSVDQIDAFAFRYCSSLSKIYYNGTTSQWNSIVKGAELFDGCIASAQVHTPVKTPVIGQSVTYGTKLSEITLPNGWVWANPDEVPAVGSNSYAAYYAVDGDYFWDSAAGYDAANNRLVRDVAVTVVVPVESVSLDATATVLEGGEIQLALTVSPDNATNKAVTWQSNDLDIATVDADGKVTGVKAGTATISVTTQDGNKTGTCEVTVQKAVADVNGTKYATIEDALNAAQNGDTVTVLADTNLAKDYTLAGNKNITLDVGSWKVTGTLQGMNVFKIIFSSELVVKLEDGGTVPLNGYPGTAKLTLEGEGFNQNVVNSSGTIINGNFGHMVQNSGTILDGNFKGELVNHPNGVIKDGYFSGLYRDFGGTIEGGHFTEEPKFDPQKGGNLADGKKFINVGGEYPWQVVDANIAVCIGDTVYMSLQDAINAAEDGDIVTLLDNVVLSSDLTVTKSCTIDAGDYAISGITDSIRMGINSSVELNMKGTVSVAVYSSGTILGGTYSRHVQNDGTIKGGTFTVDGDVCNYGTIENGVFNASVFTTGTISGGSFVSPPWTGAGNVNYAEGYGLVGPTDGYYRVVHMNHNENWTIDGDTLTMTCATCNEKLTAKLTAPAALTYDGVAKEAKLETTGYWGNVAMPTVTYTGNTTNVGQVTASITMGGQTVSVTYNIIQATAAAPTTPTVEPVTYGVNLSNILLTGGWVWADDTIIPTVDNNGYAAYYAIADDSNYDWSSVDGYNAANHRVERTVTVTVNKADPAHTVPTGLTATYGDTLVKVSLPTGWTWDIPTTSVGNVGSNPFSATFTPSDTANYNTVTADITVTVGKATLTVAAEAKAKVYGDADPALTYTVSGFMGTDTADIVTGELSRTIGENVANYAINQGTLDAGENYTISFTSANLTINKAPLTIKANDQTITYGEKIATGLDRVTVTGLVNDETLNTITLLPSGTDATNDGAITPSDAKLSGSLDNYSITYTPGKLTINKAVPTYTAPTDKTLTYNGEALNLVIPGTTQNGTFLYKLDNGEYSETIPTATNAGTYTVYWKLTGDQNHTDVDEQSITVTIAPKMVVAPNIILSQTIFIYDGTEKKPTVTVKYGETVIPNTEYTVTYKFGEEETTEFTEAGTYTVVITDNEDGNYTVNDFATFVIAPTDSELPVVVNQNGVFTYGDTITVTGLVAPKKRTSPMSRSLTPPSVNEAALFLGSTQLTASVPVNADGTFSISYNTADKGIAATGVEQILTVKYGGNSNLNAGVADMKITLNKKPVTAEVKSGTTKVYDGTDKANVELEFADGAILIGDTVTVTAPDAVYDNKNAGTDKTITIGSLTVGGTDAVFYLVTAPTTVTGSITKADPNPKFPEDLTAATGQTLRDVELPDGWTWDQPDTVVKNPVGNQKFSATFTPSDTANYNTVKMELNVNVDSHVVTFDSKGGTAVAPVIVKDGESMKAPETPTRKVAEGETVTGWAFAGWYTESGESWDFDTDTVTDTTTLHAKWNVLYSYSLVYEKNTSSKVTNMPNDFKDNLSENTELKLRIAGNKPKRSGYTFTGWNTQANGKGKTYQPGKDVPGIKDGTVTLYAQWKQNSGSWWDNPKTGDYIMIAVAVLAVSGIALAGLLVYSKKKKK